jgi:hypothetical protein
MHARQAWYANFTRRKPTTTMSFARSASVAAHKCAAWIEYLPIAQTRGKPAPHSHHSQTTPSSDTVAARIQADKSSAIRSDVAGSLPHFVANESPCSMGFKEPTRLKYFHVAFFERHWESSRTSVEIRDTYARRH